MATDRAPQIQRALRLEALTLGWNVVEGVVAVTAALFAGSVALLAFGIDSLVESASAGILLWRLLAERQAGLSNEIEAVETKARKLVAVSLFALATWVVYDAGRALWRSEAPEPSLVGIVLTSVSLVVMLWLARAKRQMAAALQSRALAADSFQTTACWWLSLSALVGITLNAVLGWWWADPAAALVIVFLLLKEGREAWKGEDSCNDCGH